MQYSLNPAELIEVVSSVMRDDNYRLILARLARDQLIDNKVLSLGTVQLSYLDIISLPIFRLGDFNIAYNGFEND